MTLDPRENHAKHPPWRRRRVWAAATVCLGLALGLGWATLSRAVSVRAYSVPTGSMTPSLMPGDRVAVQTRPDRPPRRGEVWVARFPPSAGAVGELVKRVVGLPGETVEVTGGRVVVNGAALDEPYFTTPIQYTMAPLTLGPDSYLLLGDQRNTSFDGHIWGPLPASHLVGPVVGRYWPLERLGGL